MTRGNIINYCAKIKDLKIKSTWFLAQIFCITVLPPAIPLKTEFIRAFQLRAGLIAYYINDSYYRISNAFTLMIPILDPWLCYSKSNVNTILLITT